MKSSERSGALNHILVTGMSGVGKSTEVMVDRIRSRSADGYGTSPTEMAHVLADTRSIEPLLRASCTHEIVTTVPVEQVVDRLLEIARSTR